MTRSPGFEFVPDLTAWEARGGITVRVPDKIRSKQKLIAILADRLRLPSWNCRNWDALEEALRDLSWLPAGCVSLVHTGLPFGDGGDSRGIYLSILREACRFWADDPQRRLIAVFPSEAAEAAASALASADHQHHDSAEHQQ